MKMLASTLLQATQHSDPWRGLFQLEAITMDQTSHSGITGPMQLQALIADLNWRLQLLNSDLAEESVRGGSRSTLAQHLKARHNNLVATVAMLEKQLTSIGSLARATQPMPQGRRRRRQSQSAVPAAWKEPATSAQGLNR